MIGGGIPSRLGVADMASDILIIPILGASFLVGWVAPIVLGVIMFQRKGYSPHWMWFGVHPLTGWIAALIAVFIQQRRQCHYCGGYVEANFRLCPYCGEHLLNSVPRRARRGSNDDEEDADGWNGRPRDAGSEPPLPKPRFDADVGKYFDPQSSPEREPPL